MKHFLHFLSFLQVEIPLAWLVAMFFNELAIEDIFCLIAHGRVALIKGCYSSFISAFVHAIDSEPVFRV